MLKIATFKLTRVLINFLNEKDTRIKKQYIFGVDRELDFIPLTPKL